MKYYLLRDSISVRMLGENTASVFNPDTGRRRYINSTGVIIWKMLDGSRSIEDISRALAEEFDSPDESSAKKDVSEFLGSLESGGFARVLNLPEKHRIRNDYIFSYEAPTSFDVSVTKNCNLKCSYCFYEKEMRNREDLEIKEWEKFFTELKNLAVENLCLSGGEVFFRKDIWDFIDAVIGSNLRYSILTNGTLFDEEKVKEIEKGRRKTRLSYIQFSIDGPNADIHDLSRGTGSFEKALKGLIRAKEAGLNVSVRMTVNKFNLDYLEETAKFLLEEIGLSSFSTNDAIPMGAGCANEGKITLNPFEQVEAIKTLGHLSEKFDGRIIAQAGPLAKWREYRLMEKLKKNGEKPRSGMGYLTACGCVYNKLAVHHDGVIVPCNMLPDIELGKINIDPIRDIWLNSPVLKKMKERRLTAVREAPGCGECEWNLYCNGSCPALAGVTPEDFIKANTVDCYRKLKETTGAEFSE
ncbi:PqqD family peptide modification chaperone [candidate division WOR-3 bacterium]|nr:PqqD family peptide modification chaperone [candidate division WOR-3 bacterium]